MPYQLPYERTLLTFHAGLNTSKDPAALGPGELSVATGCEYRTGSPHVYKQPGRSTAATITGTPSILGLHQFQYDTGTSKIIAYGNDGKLYESNVALALAFGSAVYTLLSTSAVPHFNSFSDRWLMVNGSDNNLIRESLPVINDFGTHTAGSSTTTMTDANKTGLSAWTVNQWVGFTAKNLTDATSAVITANIANAFTTAGINWDLNDRYEIVNNWRLLGMQPARGTTYIATVGTPTIPAFTARGATAWASNTGNYVSPGLAFDVTANPFFFDTAASGTVDSITTTRTHTWEYIGAGTAGTATNVTVRWGMLTGRVGGQVFGGQNTGATHKLEFSLDNGATFRTAHTLSIPVASYISSINIPSGTTLANVFIRVTLTYVSGIQAVGTVYDLAIQDSASTDDVTTTTTNKIQYMVTERFVDSDDVAHESVATVASAPQTISAAYAVKVYLPGIASDGTGTVARSNTFTKDFVIYRSIDEAGGGYPIMWEIGVVPWSATNGALAGGQTFFTDTFDLSPTSNADKTHLYETIAVRYPDGGLLNYPINEPPKKSAFTITYQGSVLYFPTAEPRRVYYSVPTTIGVGGAEQVPAVYYLDFQTTTNDTALCGALTNGGRSLIVYFPAYSMLVNYLPQANDPSVFDTRVREYVSQVRGASGRFCATAFTLPNGSTLAAAADSLGLWVTDGVSGVNDWSVDFNWRETFDGVNLSTAQLRDNSEMRRLELLYTSTGTTRKELHFFYGEVKENSTPKITGPHPAGDASATTPGWQCAHYTFADTSPARWLGWKGSARADGNVFLERMTTAGASTPVDAADAHDSTGIIPFTITSGENYFAGLGQGTIIEMGHPKFSDGTAKAYTLVGTFRRDGSSAAITKTKTFTAIEDKKVYWHRYADRHKISIQDLTNTAMPALVGYEIFHRAGGMSKAGAAAP